MLPTLPSVVAPLEETHRPLQVGLQHTLGLRPDAVAFRRRFGPWRIIWDTRNHTPRSLIGPGIPIGRADELVREVAAMAGVPLDRLRRGDTQRGGALRVVTWQQLHDGRPVAEAGIEVFSTEGRITFIRARLHRVELPTGVERGTFIAPIETAETLRYSEARIVEDGDLITWMDTAGGPLARYSSVLDATPTGPRGEPLPAAPVLRKALDDADAWLRRQDPSHPWLAIPLQVDLGGGVACGAQFANGVLRFGAGGPSCKAPSQVADLVVHEYAHGIHTRGMLAGVLSPAVAEGAADYIAATLSNNPRVAADLHASGEPLRDLGVIRQAPGDLSRAPHQSGRIFGSFAWALREELGAKVVDRWLVELLRYGPTYEGLFELGLLADDPDGDLRNGTPHQCALQKAMLEHGLGTAPMGTVVLDHTPPPPQGSSVESYAVTFDLTEAVPGCADSSPSQVLVVVLGPDGEVAIPAMRSGVHHVATLPRAPAGSWVHYRLVWTEPSGRQTTVPDAGTFSFQVGDTEPVWCADPKTLALKGSFAPNPSDDRPEAVRGVGSGSIGLPAIPRTSPSLLSLRGDANLTLGANQRLSLRSDGASIWSEQGLRRDGGYSPLEIDLVGLATEALTLELSGGAASLDALCVVTLADSAAHHHIRDLTAETTDDEVILQWTQPWIVPLDDVLVYVSDVEALDPARSEPVARVQNAPGEVVELRLPNDGPAFYTVLSGTAPPRLVIGENQVDAGDLPEDSGDTGDTDAPVRDSADTADTGDTDGSFDTDSADTGDTDGFEEAAEDDGNFAARVPSAARSERIEQARAPSRWWFGLALLPFLLLLPGRRP